MLLKCSASKEQREEFVCTKWLDISDYTACKKILDCTTVTKFKNQMKVGEKN
jgi:hypothetical protein